MEAGALATSGEIADRDPRLAGDDDHPVAAQEELGAVPAARPEVERAEQLRGGAACCDRPELSLGDREDRGAVGLGEVRLVDALLLVVRGRVLRRGGGSPTVARGRCCRGRRPPDDPRSRRRRARGRERHDRRLGIAVSRLQVCPGVRDERRAVGEAVEAQLGCRLGPDCLRPCGQEKRHTHEPSGEHPHHAARLPLGAASGKLLSFSDARRFFAIRPRGSASCRRRSNRKERRAAARRRAPRGWHGRARPLRSR